jgi:plasmid stabilization system protein ParE
MTHRVVVTAAAKQDLRSAYQWAAERVPETAGKWLVRFEAELASLSHFPERCPLAHENGLVEAEIRELLFGRRQGVYRALFTIVGSEVQILHIRRAARDWATTDELKID